MGDWICDDRKPIITYEHWKFLHDMSDEEFEAYIAELEKKEKKEA